jgi:hypothetical protein
MQASNIASRTLRTSESGLVWEEKISNSTGSLELEPCSTFRVRATGATTVTIDGILAATMSSNEIMVFNCGDGDQKDSKATVTVVIAAANAFVQVARNKDRKIDD